MTTSAARHVELDSTHSMAICREIGQRLDLYFRKDSPQPEESPELQRLLARLRQLDERH